MACFLSVLHTAKSIRVFSQFSFKSLPYKLQSNLLSFSALSVKDDYSRVKAQAEPAEPTVSATKAKKADASSLFDEWERTGDWADTEQTTEPAESTRSGWDFFKSLVAENLGVEAPPPDNSTADTTEADAVARENAAATSEPTPPCSVLLPVDFSRGVKCWNDTEIWSRDLVMEKVLSQLWKTFDPMAAINNQTDNTEGSYRKSSTEKGGRLTDWVSSRHKSNLKSAESKICDEMFCSGVSRLSSSGLLRPGPKPGEPAGPSQHQRRAARGRLPPRGPDHRLLLGRPLDVEHHPQGARTGIPQ